MKGQGHRSQKVNVTGAKFQYFFGIHHPTDVHRVRPWSDDDAN